MKNEYTDIIHSSGINPCNSPAIRIRSSLKLGDTVRASDVTHVDGAPYLPGETPRCDHCGTAINLSGGSGGYKAWGYAPGKSRSYVVFDGILWVCATATVIAWVIALW